MNETAPHRTLVHVQFAIIMFWWGFCSSFLILCVSFITPLPWCLIYNEWPLWSFSCLFPFHAPPFSLRDHHNKLIYKIWHFYWLSLFLPSGTRPRFFFPFFLTFWHLWLLIPTQISSDILRPFSMCSLYSAGVVSHKRWVLEYKWAQIPRKKPGHNNLHSGREDIVV